MRRVNGILNYTSILTIHPNGVYVCSLRIAAAALRRWNQAEIAAQAAGRTK